MFRSNVSWLPAVLALFLVLTACATTGSGNSESGAAEGEVTIGISQLLEHPSLDAARKGFIQALNDHGYEKGKNVSIVYENAQNDSRNFTTIAKKFVNNEVDLMLGIGTNSTVSLANQSEEIPILFTAVTDPVGAGLVESLENPGGNVTGTSDNPPNIIKKLMERIEDYVPDAEKVGVVYNSGEQNSVVQVEEAKGHLEDLGLTLVEKTVINASEVKTAAESFGDIDALYMPTDNTVVTALDALVGVAAENDWPLFTGETDSVRNGAFAGYGFSFEQLGYQTGEMAVRILEGEKTPADIPVEYIKELDLLINRQAAEEQGVTITDQMRDQADFYDPTEE